MVEYVIEARSDEDRHGWLCVIRDCMGLFTEPEDQQSTPQIVSRRLVSYFIRIMFV